MSNSNFNITKVKVDPVSQEITELEINGKSVETGGSEANLEEVVFDESNPLNVATIFGERTIPVQIYPSEGYDGIEQITIQPGGLTGYPEYEEVLISKMYDSENDTYETFAFEKIIEDDPYAIVNTLSDYIKRDGKTWIFIPGTLRFELEEVATVTIGNSYVSVGIRPNTYKNADLNDFSFAYIPKTN